MERLNLCIDIDGTVTDPYYWLERANRYFGKNVTPEEVTSYDIHRVLGIDADDYMEFYDLYSKAIHKESYPRFGASEVIKRLFNNHHIHFVTAREDYLEKTSIEWLAKHEMPLDTIHHLGSHYKVEKAKELKSDLFIEDSYHNAIQLSKAGFDVILINCNYNKGPLPANVHRVNNWFEILSIVKIREQRKIFDFKLA